MILLVNGPNLNLLGEREAGQPTLADVQRMVAETCAGYGLEVKVFQSNWEGALLDFLQEHRHEARGVILNPGALAQTSRALAECVRSLRCSTIEVHISNVHGGEAWSRGSLIARVARGQIAGLGVAGYRYAAVHLCSEVAAQAAVGMSTSGRECAAASGYGDAAPPPAQPEVAPRASVPAAATPAPGARGPVAPPAAGGLGMGDLLPEPSQQVPVDQMPRGDYEPL